MRRPSGDQRGLVLGALRVGEPADRAVGDLDGEDVVVEEAIGVGLAVRDEQDLVAARRPVDRVLVVVARRSAAAPASVATSATKMCSRRLSLKRVEPFRRGRLVEVARDDHRVAVRVVGLGAGRGRDERDLPCRRATRRSARRTRAAGGWCPVTRGDELGRRVPSARDDDQAPTRRIAAAEAGDARAVGRPAAAADDASAAVPSGVAFPVREVHDPGPGLRPPRAVAGWTL